MRRTMAELWADKSFSVRFSAYGTAGLMPTSAEKSFL